MTRIAIISDIHGNLPAFDAVRGDIKERGIDEVLVAGDLVGRGPQGDDVVCRVRDLGWLSVRGNHEDYLVAFRDRTVPKEWFELDEWAAARWMADELSESSLDYIRDLPFSMRSQLESGVLVFHGTPRSNREGLGKWSDPDLLKETLFCEDCEVMVVAHTHRAEAWNIDGRLLINVGSVGLPFNGDAAAQYAIIEKADGSWSHELATVAYDFEKIEKVYHDSGFLSSGGLTSRLLLKELKYARPFLVPFQKWTELIGEDESSQELDAFLKWYDCSKETKENVEIFHKRLAERKS